MTNERFVYVVVQDVPDDGRVRLITEDREAAEAKMRQVAEETDYWAFVYRWQLDKADAYEEVAEAAPPSMGPKGEPVGAAEDDLLRS